jgi:hypothetical protein
VFLQQMKEEVVRDGERSGRIGIGVAVAVFIAGTIGVSAQTVVNPADKQAERPQASTNEPSRRLKTWELPAIIVEGKRMFPIREEERVGSYEQPRWTTERRFPRVRVYVIPEGMTEFEFWVRADVPRHGGPTEIQNMYELEIGLPHRFQLDYYIIARRLAGMETYLDQQFELRYALADWGTLFGNPTLYAEYVMRDQKVDKFEFKLLLGDELAPRWHWGVNLVSESETGGERAWEKSATAGLSYALIDQKFSIGVEGEAAFSDVAGSRGDYTKEYYAGPSVQVRPVPNMHVDLAPLFGLTDDSEMAKLFLNMGWEF